MHTYDVWNLVSALSSVATLVLFAFYFIGRIITIKTAKGWWKDKIIVLDDASYEDYFKYGIVDDVCALDCASSNDDELIQGLLLSKNGIRDLRIYVADCISKPKKLKFKRGKMIFERKFLNIDEAVALHITLGDMFPTYYIEYTATDYMKVKLEWKENLKDGVFSEFAQSKHTIRSIIYYLVR